MEKRLILAIALSVLVILGFQFLFPSPRKAGNVQQDLPGEPAVASLKEPLPETKDFAPLPEEPTEKETYVETEKYILTFTNIGGSIKSIKLKEYQDKDSATPFVLVSDAAAGKAIFSVTSSVLINSLEERRFELAEKQHNKLVYTYEIPGKFRISKIYYFNNTNYYIDLQLLIENLQNTTIYKDYDLLGGSCLSSSEISMGRRLLEIDSMVNGKVTRDKSVKNGESFIQGIVSWTGLKERYFCIILKPGQNSAGVVLKQFDKDSVASGIRSERAPIYPSGTSQDSYMLYAGPINAAILRGLDPEFAAIVDYGMFGGITKFLLLILHTFHKLTKNWGVAIIMLTLLINLGLFPLTKKSFQSMKKIQEVQPHIEKLRQVHKDNPQRMNKELAELYKKYQINPFGGCLPLILQMPIFVALYQGLMRSIELKGANFLWIKDLSQPDIIKIPFQLPIIGSKIHLLPILMIIAMVFQQKITSKYTPATTNEQKQQQKLMLIIFPIFFGFLFYNFPSGLVIYWFTNTLLMTVEQATMRRAHK
ncbi:MAG: membrane protein insertase YidC [Candidatus Omnitrophica bacterium]|nr:membrane protein insertase YidC [Candidatus Omnitrophota bacterium]